MQKILDFLKLGWIKIYEKFKSFSLKKKILYIVLILFVVLVVLLILKPTNNSENITTDFVKLTDLKQTVLATGQVTSNTDLNLSFNKSGIVKGIKVKVGDIVKEGDILANLEQDSELASLTSARGALAAANARYRRILEGATNEEIAIAQVALDQTKLTQETLIKNAYKNLLNSTPEALPYNHNNDYVAPIISGTYNKEKEGDIIISIYRSSNGYSFTTEGLVVSSGPINELVPSPMGDSGLYISFSDLDDVYVSKWVVSIPNKKAADYLTNYNNYQAVLTQAKAAIDQRTAELDLKKAKARQSDIDLALADIISAEGQVQLAEASYNDTIIKAPADGTITKVDVKIGELSQALKEVMVLQDVNNLYLETNVNEANIANIKLGAEIDVTFDAFDIENIFKGRVIKIDPSSTIVSGVVNYKVTASLDSKPELRPGMTANMTILVAEKDRVLTIPTRAIIKDKTGAKTVRLVTNTKTKTFEEVSIVTGMDGDGGLSEVISPLKEGEEVVVLIKK